MGPTLGWFMGFFAGWGLLPDYVYQSILAQATGALRKWADQAEREAREEL